MSRALRLFGLAALCAVPAMGQDGATDDGSFLERQIEGALSGAGRQVIVTGFAGALSSSATLERMTIADDDGIWLTLIGAELDWNRGALLRGALEVDRLTAEAIELPRLPQSQSGPDLPSVEAKPFQLPDLPVSINLGELSVASVTLGAPILGEAVQLSIAGAASLAGGEGEARLSVDRTDGTGGTLSLLGRFENATDALTLDLDLNEPVNGIAARLLNLPGQPAIELVVDGSGVLSDFLADIRLATDGQERLAGQVELLESQDGGRRFAAELGGDLAPVFAPEFEPFFGPDIRLRTSGTQFADGRLTLDALDLTARALQLSGMVALGPGGAPEVIALDGQISDPVGGPVRLPVSGGVEVGAARLDIAFDAARGPDWTADITLDRLDTDGADVSRVDLIGRGAIQPGEDGVGAVTANLTFDATGIALEDPGAQEALGDQVTGAASLDWSSGAPVVLDGLSVSGASFDFDGRGQVATSDTGPVARFDGAVIADALAAFSTLAGRPLGGAARVDARVSYGLTSRAFDVGITGRAEDLRIDQRQFDRAFAGLTELEIAVARDETGTRVETLSLVNAAATLSGQASLSSATSSAELSLVLPDAARIEPELAGPARVAIVASGQPGDWTVDANIAAIGAEIAFDGTLDDVAATPVAGGALRVSGLDLTRIAPVVDRPLAGVLGLDMSGTALIDLSRFDVAGQITGDGLRTGVAEADAAWRGRSEITLSARRVAGAEAIAVERLTATSDTLALEATGAFDPGQSRLSLSGTAPDLTPFGRGLSGPARISAGLSEGNGGWTVDADIAALGATVAYAGRIEDPQDVPFVSGQAEIAGLDLTRVADLAGRPLSGLVSAEVSGSARADLSSFDIDAAARTRDITTGIPEADAALRGAGSLALALRKEGPEALLQLDRFAFDSDTVTAEGSGSYAPKASQVRLSARVPDLTPFGRGLSGPAEVTATADEDAVGWAVTARAGALGAEAAFDGRVEELDSGVPLVSGRARLDDLDLARLRGIAGRPLSGRASAAVDGRLKTDQSAFDVTANVTGTALALGIPDVDQLLRGTTAATLTASKAASGQPILLDRLSVQNPAVQVSANGRYGAGQSAVQLSARLDDIGRFTPDFSGPVTAEGRVGEAGTGVSVDLTATGPGGLTVAVDGTAALDFQQVNLGIRGNAPLGLANTIIAPQSIQGTADFNLALNGAPGLPALTGVVTTEGTRAVLPGPGIVLNDIAATLRLANSTAQVAVTANKQAGGRLAVRGDVGLAGAQPVDLVVELAEIVVEDPALYRTTANGRLTLTGALGGAAQASGTIELGQTEIRVPSTGLGSAGPIPELVHLNEPRRVRTTRSYAGLLNSGNGGGGSGSGVDRRIELDVAVVAPNRIFVRGRGLDAELGGRLLLSGTTRALIPSGEFELIRGRLDILGKRLTLTEGNVALQGDFKPFIRLVAQTEANDVDLFVALEGPLDAPEITFSSQPELPEDEVLAQLLFGKSLNTISPLQAARLALAVRTLAGKGGEGVVGRLRSQFGLSDLDVTTDDEGNAAVRAGAYLSENVYSDVTVTATGETEVNLNLDLTPNLTARGSVNNDGETSLGIFFEKDY